MLINRRKKSINNQQRQQSRKKTIDTVMGCHNDQEHLEDIESDNEEVSIVDSLAI